MMLDQTFVQTRRSVFRIIKMKRNCPSHRLPWAKDQDDYLMELVDSHGEKHWKEVEQRMKTKFPNFPANGKRCRERWLYIGRVGIDKSPLTELEAILLLAYHRLHSNSWASIAKKISNRSPSTLKNNFYGFIKKTAKQVSLYAKGDLTQCQTPLQFYITLYMTTLLTEMLDVRDPSKDSILEYNKSKTPPHIAEYVYFLKVPMKLYQAYIIDVKSRCGIGKEWKCSTEVMTKLKMMPFEEIKKFCEDVSEAILENASFNPNDAVSKSIEKVLRPCGNIHTTLPLPNLMMPHMQLPPMQLPPMQLPHMQLPTMQMQLPPMPMMNTMWLPMTHQWIGTTVVGYQGILPVPTVSSQGLYFK